MKNPFPKLVAKHYPSLVKPESRQGWALATEDGERLTDPTPEQIQYAAEAINSHDSLVRQRDKALSGLETMGGLIELEAQGNPGQTLQTLALRIDELIAEIEAEKT